MAFRTDRTKSSGNGAETTTMLLKVVHDLSAELHPSQAVTQSIPLDSSLDRDLGLDSLARVELLARLERAFDVTLEERAFMDAETTRDLLRAVDSAGVTTKTDGYAQVKRLALGDVQSTPHSAQTLIDVLRWHMQTHPDRPHIEFYQDKGDGGVLTYQQLWQGARVVARGLQSRGLQWSEPVVIMLPTGREYFVAFFAILLAGGVPVPIYPPARRTQIEDHLQRHRAILRNCGATTLITIREAKPFARLLRSHVESMRDVITVTELSNQTGVYEDPALGADDIALLQYTSGSTGNPKGVVLTHANLLANLRVIGESAKIDDTDVAVSWLPLYHDMGLIGTWLGSLYFATLLVVMSPLDFIARPQRWLWAIHRYRGTLSAAPNFAYEFCIRKIKDADLEGLDLSSLRLICNGAEPVSPDTIQRFSEKFAEFGFRPEAMFPVYGLAENSLALAFPPLGRLPLVDTVERDSFAHHGRAIPVSQPDTPSTRFVGCGLPLPQHEVRIVDASGRELPERQVGRLEFRGPSSTSGYYRNPEATRDLFNGDWLGSGDLAYIADGDVYITGRSKDIIIRAGRNIVPRELEETIGNITGIRKGNVVTFGTIDPESSTERLVIVAETRETDVTVLDRLRSEINALAVDLVQIPADDVVLVPPGSILKTSSGKIRRLANRECYENGQLGKTRHAWWQIVRAAFSGLRPEIMRLAKIATTGLYAAYVWGLFATVAGVLWTPVVLLPQSSWRWWLIRRASRFLRRATGLRTSVQGLEHIPADGPCVLVANHASYLDSFVLLAVLPRPIRFVAKSELTRHFHIRIPLRRLRTAFVERFDKQKGIEDARRIARTAGDGWPLLFYSEGALRRMPGLHPFHMGAFIVATESDLPVVPIALRGTRSMMRPGTWFPRRGEATVTIGETIRSDVKTGRAVKDPWSAALKRRDAARAHILRHCGEPDLAKWNRPIAG
ncbi:MAG: AMP-binding protein [Candidatus Krumholzibacteria bacterium]|nr:AMP-binding protein [Candidatus Krumholzibacteria bacterium]